MFHLDLTYQSINVWPCICLISYKPYVMVVSSVFTWNIPQFATLSPLSPLSLSGPAPGSGWRGWWPSQSPQTPVSQPPGPVIPSSAPVTSIPPARAFYIYTGTFKQVVFKYSDRYDTIVCTVWKCTNMCGLYVPILHYILFIIYYLK